MRKPSNGFSKSKPFDFEHQQQHTLDGFDRLASQARQEISTPRDMLTLGDALLSNGHPDTPLVAARLKAHPHRDAVAMGVLLESCFHQLRRRFRLEEVDRKQIVRAYRKDGYLLFQSPHKSRKLLVVFTTIFNNFYLSHIALHAMLKDLGCHLLLLKETTLANYQRGVASFASDFPGIADQIRATARQLGADQIYVSGFSSGGYAALLTSLRLPCSGYFGLSHSTDLSPGAMLARPWYLTENVYAQLDRRWLLDLRVLLQDADPAVPRVLCYGTQAMKDTRNAQHLAGLPTIRLFRLVGATHNTIQYLLARDRLTAAFRTLVADR